MGGVHCSAAQKGQLDGILRFRAEGAFGMKGARLNGPDGCEALRVRSVARVASTRVVFERSGEGVVVDV
jgi:hypothetical protein